MKYTSLKHYLVLIALTQSILALAAEKDKKDPAPAEPEVSGDAQRVNVDKIKEKYWARGDESELGVVQNRLYSKERKVQLSLLGGVNSTDPFLSVRMLGVSAGFHFSEYFAAQAVLWRYYTGFSSAHDYLLARGARANTNPLYGYYGGEFLASILYGKLSLIGKSIIYYDLHLAGGLGITSTESGKYFTPSVGLGQQIYLSKLVSLSIDYRMMRFNEEILEKEIPSRIGQSQGFRANYSNIIYFGVTFLLGGEKAGDKK